jgi:hypothetical protein
MQQEPLDGVGHRLDALWLSAPIPFAIPLVAVLWHGFGFAVAAATGVGVIVGFYIAFYCGAVTAGIVPLDRRTAGPAALPGRSLSSAPMWWLGFSATTVVVLALTAAGQEGLAVLPGLAWPLAYYSFWLQHPVQPRSDPGPYS